MAESPRRWQRVATAGLAGTRQRTNVGLGDGLAAERDARSSRSRTPLGSVTIRAWLGCSSAAQSPRGRAANGVQRETRASRRAAAPAAAPVADSTAAWRSARCRSESRAALRMALAAIFSRRWLRRCSWWIAPRFR
eukprot:scaffold15394_cov111-Isochrysis_galbana.AAC.10